MRMFCGWLEEGGWAGAVSAGLCLSRGEGVQGTFCPLDRVAVVVVLSSLPSDPDFMAVMMRMFNK